MAKISADLSKFSEDGVCKQASVQHGTFDRTLIQTADMRIQHMWLLGSLVCLGIGMIPAVPAMTTPLLSPELSPQMLKDELFKIRVGIAQTQGGGKAVEKLLKKEFARDPRPEVKAYMAWACFWGKTQGMPSMFDPKRGEELALEAVAEGSIAACDVYGSAIDQNWVKGKVPVDAVPWFTTAANAGMPSALAALGIYTAYGWGMPADVERGISLARRAAILGDGNGLSHIATALESGRIGGVPDVDRAVELWAELANYNSRPAWERLKKLGESNPRARLLALIAEIRIHGENERRSPSKMRRLIGELEGMNSDDPEAMVTLGKVYLEEYYGKKYYAKAMALFRQAEEKGDEDAPVQIARMQLMGWAPPADALDASAALAELRRLADAGNALAAAYLASVYFWELVPGTEKDEGLVFRYLRQATEQGDGRSLMDLAKGYKHGIGTPANPGLAAIIYWQAYRRGYMPALAEARRMLEFAE